MNRGNGIKLVSNIRKFKNDLTKHKYNANQIK